MAVSYERVEVIDYTVQPTGTPDLDAFYFNTITQALLDSVNHINDFQGRIEDLEGTGGASATDLLNAIKTVDGPGSGLDADTLDGVQGSGYAPVIHEHAGSAITSGTVAPARLGTGTANSTTWLRGDGTWQAGGGGGGGSHAILSASHTDVNEVATPSPGHVLQRIGTEWDTAFISQSNVNPNTNTITIVCTSGTRPVSPQTGQEIYETDTRLNYVNVGTAGAPIWRMSTNTKTMVWSSQALAAGEIPKRWRTERPITILSYQIALDEPITAGSLVVDLHRATSAAPGTMNTLYTTAANRPTISSTASYGVDAAAPPNTIDIPKGDFLQPVIATAPTGGSNLTVLLEYVVRG